MKVSFSDAAMKEFKNILTRYPNKRAALLPALHLGQREFEWLSRDVLEYVGELLELPYSEVYDTASFYTMFKLKPTGKYHLQVCHTLSCALRGAAHICEHIEEKYGVGNGEVTADGKLSLIKVECLGSCGTAPVVQVNDDYHENLTIEELDKLIDSLK
jgi:NADH-quinone oxidoreductase subunit E